MLHLGPVEWPREYCVLVNNYKLMVHKVRVLFCYFPERDLFDFESSACCFHLQSFHFSVNQLHLHISSAEFLQRIEEELISEVVHGNLDLALGLH